MSEALKIAVTSACAVVAGLLIFVLQRFLLEPLNDQSRILGKIAYLLLFHAERYANPLLIPQSMPPDQYTISMQTPNNDQYQDAKADLRKCAAELYSTTTAVRAYRLWVLLRLAPQRPRVEESIGLLIGISNYGKYRDQKGSLGSLARPTPEDGYHFNSVSTPSSERGRPTQTIIRSEGASNIFRKYFHVLAKISVLHIRYGFRRHEDGKAARHFCFAP
jgi:hypothetical protein